MTDDSTRGRLAALALVATLALAALGAVTLVSAETAHTESITLDEPTNETVEVDVDFINDTDATVSLRNSSGSAIASQTITGVNGTTETFVLEPGAVDSGNYSIDVDAPNANDVSLVETRMIANRTQVIDDAANQTLVGDIAFQGDTNATAVLSVVNSTGMPVYQQSYEYVGDDTTRTIEVNESDGLVNGTYTATLTVSPASAYDGAYLGIPQEDNSIIGGTIAGQDTGIVIVVVLVSAGGYWYARREDMI